MKNVTKVTPEMVKAVNSYLKTKKGFTLGYSSVEKSIQAAINAAPEMEAVAWDVDGLGFDSLVDAQNYANSDPLCRLAIYPLYIGEAL